MATILPRGSKRLGRQLELDEDDKNCYVDLVLVLPGLCAKRNTLRMPHRKALACGGAS